MSKVQKSAGYGSLFLTCVMVGGVLGLLTGLPGFFAETADNIKQAREDMEWLSAPAKKTKSQHVKFTKSTYYPKVPTTRPGIYLEDCQTIGSCDEPIESLLKR